VDGDRDHRSATLQRQSADAATSLLADLSAARASALGIDDDHPTPRENLQRAHHRLLVAVASTHREGTAMSHDPRKRPAEELRLGHEAHAPAQVHGDEEMIEGGEVVGRDDRRSRGRHELSVDRARTVDEHAKRDDRQAHQILHPVCAVLTGPGMKRLEMLRRALVQIDLRPDRHVLSRHTCS
jgi:hypothetical protein